MENESSTVITTPKGSALIRLLRPRQWVKNAFVVAPLLFSGAFVDPAAVVETVIATALFCLASSAVYILNDLHDRERDRRHPTKRLSRPLASGEIAPATARWLLAAIYGALALCALVKPAVMAVVAGYLALNVAYTFVLKQQPVFDIFSVAVGFVLRVYGGAAALAVEVSSWMFVTTLCLALFLASVKRRQELLGSGAEGREVLGRYTLKLAERYAEISGTGALVFYALFVVSTRPELVVTIPFVLFGLYRYWYVVEVCEGGESPTDALLSDRPLLVTVMLWVGACGWALLRG
ncbi:decaprenyl-phosphate phosphoribosyltransferase [Endothiovibrio diazotrophicus]